MGLLTLGTTDLVSEMRPSPTAGVALLLRSERNSTWIPVQRVPGLWLAL